MGMAPEQTAAAMDPQASVAPFRKIKRIITITMELCIRPPIVKMAVLIDKTAGNWYHIL
jgi:hypothetical protein